MSDFRYFSANVLRLKRIKSLFKKFRVIIVLFCQHLRPISSKQGCNGNLDCSAIIYKLELISATKTCLWKRFDPFIIRLELRPTNEHATFWTNLCQLKSYHLNPFETRIKEKNSRRRMALYWLISIPKVSPNLSLSRQ